MALAGHPAGATADVDNKLAMASGECLLASSREVSSISFSICVPRYIMQYSTLPLPIPLSGTSIICR